MLIRRYEEIESKIYLENKNGFGHRLWIKHALRDVFDSSFNNWQWYRTLYKKVVTLQLKLNFIYIDYCRLEINGLAML